MDSEMNFDMDSEMNDLDRILSQAPKRSRSTAGFQERSRSTAGFQVRSCSTAGFQVRSCSTAGFQERSCSMASFQEKSRGSGYVQANFQMKSREFNPPILLPLNQNSPVSNSPRIDEDANDFQLKPRKSTSILFPVPNSPRIDEDEFRRQLARRLSNEQFYAFLDNIEELNDGKQPLDKTLMKAFGIFGTDNRDLYLTFEELVKSYQMSYQHPWSRPITAQNGDMKFFPQARSCLLFKVWFLFSQGWLIPSQESPAANSPPHEESDFLLQAFIQQSNRQALSQEFIRQASSRLSKEQLDAMVANAMELCYRKQTGEEALLKIKEIFGIVNEDLFLSFQELLSPKL